MRRMPKGAAAVPVSLFARLPHPPRATAWSGNLATGLAMLAGLLAHSVLIVVGAGVYFVRVVWADRGIVVTPARLAWEQRSSAVVPARVTRRAAGDAAASLSPYRPVVTRFLAIALLAVLVGWFVAHA